jgi:hypothetical protein
MSDDLRITDGGSRVAVNERAPVIGRAAIFIEAPIAAVWRILSDIASWPDWNLSISKMSLDGPIRAGTTFRWTAASARIKSCLQEVDPPRRIAWTGATIGIRAVHIYDLEVEGAGTRVATRESFDGLVARLLRRTLQRSLDKDLAAGLAALKAEAESQAGIFGK